MPLHRPTEDLLRTDMLAAKNSLDAAREAIKDQQLTYKEGKLLFAAAFTRYATALRRFSGLVVDGKVPPDLQP